MEKAELEPCPGCEKPISTAASACPNCGHPLDAETWSRTRAKRAGSVNPQYDSTEHVKKRGCGPIAALIVGTIFLAVFIASRKDDPNRLERDCNDSGLAYVYSRDAVREQLRAPSTADFPGKSEVVVRNLGNCRHLILGHVDAQNGFGAQIRNFYTVVMTFNKATERFDVRRDSLYISSSRTEAAAFAALTQTTLTQGSSGTEARTQLSEKEVITRIQQHLARLGYEVGSSDGVLGVRTKAAIEAYQRKYSLPVTGKPDQALLDHLSR